ncbi:FIG001454: Transglutaminase-like enzymes, putative cysteine proteases [hydrothermal vent metagenome]|uniref:FIG001454: Transglutaminase-like enzymes, putative cysteine proteases n=1 Tax=hydrothermal vent metagenome TaxID=652676 RepID=A0A1W1CCN6_9ZZZZ
MKSLHTSLDINNWQLRHLDIAYIVVLIPLLLIIKLPMLIFMLFVLTLLLLKKDGLNNSIFIMLSTTVLGILAIFISLYGTFDFAGLSKLKLFLELLIYMLIFAVSLQRLKREINFYLLLSPLLLLAFSLFFFTSVTMLGYVIFEIFIFLWLILSQIMRSSVKESLRMAGMMFALSIPSVVILFIFFPRISFDHATYGFKGDVEHRMGHDGTMFLDNTALLVPSEKIVMEVSFDKEIPPSDKLYFRGSILYTDKKDHWEKLPQFLSQPLNISYDKKGSIHYRVTLYPTNKKWLYQLDMPLSKPQIDNKEVTMSRDFITTTKEDIKEILHYDSYSFINYNLVGGVDNIVKIFALGSDKNSNPKSWSIADKIVKNNPLPEDRVNKIIELFKSSGLTYTLKPKPLDLNNSTDSFLFDTKRGYCVHFASSFATLSRMVGVPSRVITGYRGNRSNSLKNYLIVKEKDAHAWVELLIKGRWVRYDATTLASYMDSDTESLLNQTNNNKQSAINMYFMYMKYQIDTWILNYSYIRQMQLLDKAEKNPWFVAKFIGAIILIILFSYILISRFRTPLCHDKLLCLLSPLIDKLKDNGFSREDEETMHKFLQRYIELNPESIEIENIDRIYEQIRYAEDNSPKLLEELKRNIDILIKKL